MKEVLNMKSTAEMNTPSVPAGFKIVTSDEFFAALAKDAHRDPMPLRSSNYWETKNREVWGWSCSYAYGTKWIHAIKQTS